MQSVESISLTETWMFRFDGQSQWQPIAVPSCWETLDAPKDHPGPAWYRTYVVLPRQWRKRRIWLCFGAVSYHCMVYVNGYEVGRHTGAWDAFDVEITDGVGFGETTELLVKVEKPASLTCGPASEPVSGSFPLQETLAGFLPYVWGNMFGGIWQGVTLRTTGRSIFTDIQIIGSAEGHVQITAKLSSPGVVALTLSDPNGEMIHEQTRSGDEDVRFEIAIAHPRPWSLSSPDLYLAHLWLANGDERTLRFGLRSLRVEDTTIVLNGQPIYPRMVLSWGWYPEVLHCNPGPARVRANFERLKSLGYNGVKLCLWFPPAYYFELADELGMLLWVELPMWLPKLTPFFRRQVPIEYERLVRLARNHPSVVLYSLGCELNATVGADFLGPLYTSVKSMVGESLVRDNSGSGEAYGGLLNEHAEYYDYHFYSDLQFFRNLLDYFTPRWRPRQPWVFGEFCDYDTFRDLRRLCIRRVARFCWPRRGRKPLKRSNNLRARRLLRSDRPWWTLDDPQRNPQGARWQFDIVDQERRLRRNGYWSRGAELERISEQQGLFHRKWLLELVRTYREISGYVVTGEADTPIATAGMWNERGRVKFASAQFRACNGDLVLLVGWDKRRAWINGGDCAAYWDAFSYSASAVVRPHLIASHYGVASAPACLSWTVAFPNEAPFASGESTSTTALRPGSVRELAVAEFAAPQVDQPRQGTLRAFLQIDDETTQNEWPIWFFPKNFWAELAEVTLIDPTGRLEDFSRMTSRIRSDVQCGTIVITTVWTPEVERFAVTGGSVILLQSGKGPAGPIPTVGLPFWREAVRIIEPHPAWGDFPRDEQAGLQFFGCATDYALDISSLAVRPILRRLDARTMHVHDYAAEVVWGGGRLIVTTLRFEGGQGEQPLGISRNTAAAYLLSCWTRYLQKLG